MPIIERDYTELDRAVNEIVDLNDSAAKRLAALRSAMAEDARLNALLEAFATRFESARSKVEAIPFGLVIAR